MILFLVILSTICQLVTAMATAEAVYMAKTSLVEAGKAVLLYSVLPIVMLWVLYARIA